MNVFCNQMTIKMTCGPWMKNKPPFSAFSERLIGDYLGICGIFLEKTEDFGYVSVTFGEVF